MCKSAKHNHDCMNTFFFILLYKHTPVLSRCRYTHQQRKRNSLKKKTLTKSISTTIALIAKKININTKNPLISLSLLFISPHPHPHTYACSSDTNTSDHIKNTDLEACARAHTHTQAHIYSDTHGNTPVNTHTQTHALHMHCKDGQMIV